MLDHAINEHAEGWTEERVEMLKKRWVEGASAGEIANELGGGVTRSGVIGKVHRLKLAKRKNPTVAAKPKPVKRHGNAGQPKAAAIRHNLDARSNQGLAFKIAQARKDGLTGAEGMDAVLGKRQLPYVEEVEEGVDVTHLIGLLQLTEHTCKWPQGDPLQPAFGFCGHPTQSGSPYCSQHHRRAYHQI